MEPETIPPHGVPRLSVDERTRRAVDAMDAAVTQARDRWWEVFGFLRFLLFVLYLILAAAGFWLTVLAAVLGAFRILVRFAKVVMLYLAGGNPPPREGRAAELAEAAKQEIRRLWDTRLLLYGDIARPVARHYVASRLAARRFWFWSLPHKLATVVFMVLLVGVPLAYLIPRPHQVQISDDNAMTHADGDLRYLIHAIDLDDPTTHREYENEYAIYLGKINPQGLKSQLQTGRFYRLWVVGLRWYYFPTALYPNIIWATEIDRNGNALTGTALLGQASTPDKK